MSGAAAVRRHDASRVRIRRAAADLIRSGGGQQEVSVRQIAAAASANVAMIAYHFGSKEGLLAELYRTEGESVVAGRVAALAALSPDAAIGDILHAWLAPMFWPAAERRQHVALVSFLRLRHPALYAALIEEVYAPVNRRYVALLAARLPHVAERTIIWRLYALAGSALAFLDETTWASIRRFSGRTGGMDEADACVRQLVTLFAPGFAA